MRWHSNESTVGSNFDGFIYIFILTDISFYFCFIFIIESDFYDLLLRHKCLTQPCKLFYCQVVCFNEKQNTSPVINTRIHARLVCSFSQFMLLNSMPLFIRWFWETLSYFEIQTTRQQKWLRWICGGSTSLYPTKSKWVLVIRLILKYLHQEADKTRLLQCLDSKGIPQLSSHLTEVVYAIY